MGCAGSSAAQPQGGQAGGKVIPLRRRLSVGNIDDIQTGQTQEEIVEEERGLLWKITEKNILEVADELKNLEDGAQPSPAKSEQKRRVSIGSETDRNANKRQSFKRKDEFQLGDDSTSLHIGYTCRKGLKPESPNQDSWFVFDVEDDYAIYGVFDGHGAKGHDVSNLVKDYLPKMIITAEGFREDPASVMVKCFLKMQALLVQFDRNELVNGQLSGTTCTIVVHDRLTERLIVAHVGDSRAVLLRKDGETDRIAAQDLTTDHKPELKEERAYIERNGGRVAFDGFANHRLYVKNGTYPGLNMSRALGDILGSTNAGVNNTPEVAIINLPKKDVDESELVSPDGTRAVLVLCSDGVWEFISSHRARDIVMRYDKANAKAASEALAKEAWDNWIREEGGCVVDDITALVVYI
ncbi:unnamed protein product [Amoebophrya sp. A25]|nr:unnamed protein product [Amoebophrya sp. A25]|eukprot:GSA25T00004406001.1